MPVLKSVLSLFSASNVSIAEADSRSSIVTNIQPLPVTLLANDEIDHTCNVRMDYGTGNRCPGIQDGKCDNPNYGEGSEECRGQDCIDCNYYCEAFNYDCFGCNNAKGCYYCPGDATCWNSDLYLSNNKELSCNSPSAYWLNREELCVYNTLTKDNLSMANDWAYRMINLDKVWPDYTGEGIHVRINDDGVDPNNLDFNDRFDEENSCETFQPTETDSNHGTKVAGIVAGNADNRHCSAGIAYKSTFSSCNIFPGGISFSILSQNLENVDISQNSFGFPACEDYADYRRSLRSSSCPFTIEDDATYNPCTKCDFDSESKTTECKSEIVEHCHHNFRKDDAACSDFIDILLNKGTCNYDKIPEFAIDHLRIGVTQGRGGKGVIYVFASGNDFNKGQDVNMMGFTNNRYTITVGAVGRDGMHADYSTGGAALHVTAPAGDYNDMSHILTTDIGGSCTDSGAGTSYAAPVVSGVIALMLEARPELTWRDVQGILAKTSYGRSDNDDKYAMTNAAGFWHSNWYGFGIVDAKAAVDAALEWDLWTPEQQAIGVSGEENQAIPNDGTECVSELTINAKNYEGFVSEAVVILLDLEHYNRGDLELILVSPQGTSSILHPGRRPESTKNSEQWKLMTLRNWGENPSGVWKLKIKDLVADNTVSAVENELRDWTLVVYGHVDKKVENEEYDPDLQDEDNNQNERSSEEDEEVQDEDNQHEDKEEPQLNPSEEEQSESQDEEEDSQDEDSQDKEEDNQSEEDEDDEFENQFDDDYNEGYNDDFIQQYDDFIGNSYDSEDNDPTNQPSIAPITIKPTALPTTSKPIALPTTTDDTTISGPTYIPTEESEYDDQYEDYEVTTMPPTALLTSSATSLPTKQPTRIPTLLPTASPTNQPTRIPTSSPTVSRTNQPTTISLVNKIPVGNPQEEVELGECENSFQSFEYRGKSMTCDDVKVSRNVKKKCSNRTIAKKCPGVCDHAKCRCKDFAGVFQYRGKDQTCKRAKRKCSNRSIKNKCPDTCKRKDCSPCYNHKRAFKVGQKYETCKQVGSLKGRARKNRCRNNVVSSKCQGICGKNCNK